MCTPWRDSVYAATPLSHSYQLTLFYETIQHKGHTHRNTHTHYLSVTHVRWLFIYSGQWLLFYADCNFQLHHDDRENELYLMRWHWCPYCTIQINILRWIFIVLAHVSNSPRIDMSLHSDTLSWFRANHSLLSITP